MRTRARKGDRRALGLIRLRISLAAAKGLVLLALSALDPSSPATPAVAVNEGAAQERTLTTGTGMAVTPLSTRRWSKTLPGMAVPVPALP